MFQLRQTFLTTAGKPVNNTLPHTQYVMFTHGLYLIFIMRMSKCLTNKRKQGIHRHQTPPRYRNVASGSRLKVQPSTHRHAAHYGQLTSSIKSEVHKISQRPQRRTESRPQGICTKNFVTIGDMLAIYIWRYVPEICSRANRHTDRHTDTQTSRRTDRQTDRYTLLPYRGGVIKIARLTINS